MSENLSNFGKKEENQAIFGLTFGFGMVLGPIFGLIFGFKPNFGPLLALSFGFGWILFVICLIILMERHYFGDKPVDYRPSEVIHNPVDKPVDKVSGLRLLTDQTEPITLKATERGEHGDNKTRGYRPPARGARALQAPREAER